MANKNGLNYFLNSDGSKSVGWRQSIYCNHGLVPARTVFDYNMIECRMAAKGGIHCVNMKSFCDSTSILSGNALIINETPPIPSGFTVTAIGANSIHVSWDSLPENCQAYVYSSTDGINGWGLALFGGVLEWTFSGLDPSTTMYFRVKFINDITTLSGDYAYGNATTSAF